MTWDRDRRGRELGVALAPERQHGGVVSVAITFVIGLATLQVAIAPTQGTRPGPRRAPPRAGPGDEWRPVRGSAGLAAYILGSQMTAIPATMAPMPSLLIAGASKRSAGSSLAGGRLVVCVGGLISEPANQSKDDGCKTGMHEQPADHRRRDPVRLDHHQRGSDRGDAQRPRSDDAVRNPVHRGRSPRSETRVDALRTR